MCHLYLFFFLDWWVRARICLLSHVNLASLRYIFLHELAAFRHHLNRLKPLDSAIDRFVFNVQCFKRLNQTSERFVNVWNVSFTPSSIVWIVSLVCLFLFIAIVSFEDYAQQSWIGVEVKDKHLFMLGKRCFGYYFILKYWLLFVTKYLSWWREPHFLYCWHEA